MPDCQFISRAELDEHRRLYPDLSTIAETVELPKPEPETTPEWTPTKIVAITGVWIATASVIIIALFESL